MVSSAQWTNVSDALSKSIHQYQTTATTLEANTVLMSQEVFALLVDWKGKAPIAFTDSQQQSARDAYRVATALVDASYLMLSLLSTIQTNQQVISRYQTIAGLTVDDTEVTTITSQYNAAILAIQQQSSSLGVHLGTVAQTLGTTCSTGKESLPPGQIDGVVSFYDENGKVVLVSQAGRKIKQKAKDLWKDFLERQPGCWSPNWKDLKNPLKWVLSGFIALLAGGSSLFFNSLVAWEGDPANFHTAKGSAVGWSNAAQGVLGIITSWLASALGCSLFGKDMKILALPVFASAIGGGAISFGLFYHVINPRLNPPPNLPLEPSRTQQEGTMTEIQRELQDPLISRQQKDFLRTQYRTDVNAYYNEFGTYPPGYVPDTTPTSTPTPGVTPVPGLTPYQPTGKSTPVPGLTPFK